MFVITNGSHWNSKIENLVNELNFDVAVSIDAYDKEKVERIRKNVVYEKLIENIHRFSEICNRKGKHLSLSFTVQKDNWEQLPLIINLCNKVNAYIYVSYLERPLQFVLTTLPKQELVSIRTYMEQFTFPKLTQKERHNAKCFEDFKHYLDTYIENPEVKRYHDYEFNRDVLTAKEQENNEPDYRNLKPVTFAEFEAWLHKQYNSDESFAQLLPPAQLHAQLNPVLNEYAEHERNLLHALIMQGSFKPFLLSVKNASTVELKKLSRETLDKYNKLVVTV